MLIAMTGATGSMGRESVKNIIANTSAKLRLLIEDNKAGRRAAEQLRKKYRGRVSCFFGSITESSDCDKLVRGSDVVFHLAAVIPPRADSFPELADAVNFGGTVNMVRAAEDDGKVKFVYISSVAVYGHRTFAHPWGRVGDPLIPSAFDAYGNSKVRAERVVLESKIRDFAVLRQTGILHPDIMTKNLRDGLVFHTPWNVPIEWITARDSGRLMGKIAAAEERGENGGFWGRVYDIGGGEKCRQTGYEMYDSGFKLIGGSTKSFFRPRDNCARNFHCLWFSDSDILEDMFSFRSEDLNDFWRNMADRHKFYVLGKAVPKKLLRNGVIEALYTNPNSPTYWAEHGDIARVTAFFGGQEAYERITKDWEKYGLVCERPGYEKMKNQTFAERSGMPVFLNHGYDESKPDGELSIEDMREAARFRGGECLSDSMEKGDLRSKLLWKCAEGHIFKSSPFAVLKAGHWCPECCETKDVWRFDEIAKKSPFFAQVWYDSHGRRENFVYRLADGNAIMEVK